MAEFRNFLETFSTGIVDSEKRVKLDFDQYDEDLYDRFALKNKVVAALVILARYGYLRHDLQKEAIASGVYFENVDESKRGSPGILVIRNNKFEQNTYIGELRKRIKDKIPLLTRWGSRNPSSSTGIDSDRLTKGMWLNYHAKRKYATDVWKYGVKDTNTQEIMPFKSEEEFLDAIYHNKNLEIPTINGSISTSEIHNMILTYLKSKNLSTNESIIVRIIHHIYLKLGKIIGSHNPDRWIYIYIANAVKQIKYDINREITGYKHRNLKQNIV